MRRQLMLFLLHKGYMQQSCCMGRRIGLRLLAQHVGESDGEDQRHRLHKVLLDLHGMRQQVPDNSTDRRNELHQ